MERQLLQLINSPSHFPFQQTKQTTSSLGAYVNMVRRFCSSRRFK